ncbi:DNA-directed DNA polymerase [Thermoanaerobacter mathranii subsp. mathranii str. A3]|uniref:DNA polymerase IV n=1 Tax=Thermoanaerobacter mathranii subsp. mathranii (strain DSM 11426 / CCUG 53645 / CIP 108742 / A3) TaxID=583358 RepID=A0ABM5LMY0_THEM3|nr:DNA polymerase IV [Thermoanaerobacter mathranii]ADH60078.1 DNA-directed DNA polymerase [Thermoanaerobacter mathranii subsp. mathranii str. A3]
MKRKIIHVDMDAFFASVEQHDNPKYKGKPVIVGGLSGRGVVSTCSYEARKYGIHSAMPMYMARKLCPHGIFLSVRRKRYEEVSKQIFDILYSITPLVEPVSIDEAYLDVTDIDKNPEVIAKEIKKKVKETTGLTISAGVSYNKFLAKLASDWNKPDGFTVITEDMIPDILKPLPVSKVYGIGEKSEERLKSMGINTIGDLLKLSQENLVEIFGKVGVEIYLRIRGIDERPVETMREIKSIGKEKTLEKDTKDKKLLLHYAKLFSDIISEELFRAGLYARTVTVKIKTSDFAIHTKSKTLNKYIRLSEDIYNVAYEIIENIKLDQYIRLIGLSVSNLSAVKYEQLSFLDKSVVKSIKAENIAREINKKIGQEIVKKASELLNNKTKQWRD